MARISFVIPDGQTQSIDYRSGGSLMEAAIAEDVPGIEAQCYGAGVCGTCHLYVGEEWMAAAGEKSAWEQDMLDCLSLARPNSRLACQIMVDEGLDGACFTIPARQESLE